MRFSSFTSLIPRHERCVPAPRAGARTHWPRLAHVGGVMAGALLPALPALAAADGVGGGGSGGGGGGIGGAVSASAPGAWALPALGLGLSVVATQVLGITRSPETQAHARAALLATLRHQGRLLGWPLALLGSAALFAALAWQGGGLEGVLLSMGPALVAVAGRTRAAQEGSIAGADERLPGALVALAATAAALGAAGLFPLALALVGPWLAMAMAGTLGKSFAQAHRLLWVAATAGSLWSARDLLDPWLARGMAGASALALRALGPEGVLDGTTLITRGISVEVTALCAGTGILLAPFVLGAMVTTLWVPGAQARRHLTLGLFGAALATNLLRIVSVALAAGFLSRDALLAFHDQLGWALSLGLYLAFGTLVWRARRRAPAA